MSKNLELLKSFLLDGELIHPCQRLQKTFLLFCLLDIIICSLEGRAAHQLIRRLVVGSLAAPV